MGHEDSGTNFWALSSSQLAAQIALIANGDPTAIDDDTRAEADLLVAECRTPSICQELPSMTKRAG